MTDLEEVTLKILSLLITVHLNLRSYPCFVSAFCYLFGICIPW